MKYEWKKQDKDLYGAKEYPALITVPAQNYVMISGRGNPNDTDFSARVAALYSFAYAVKARYRTAAASGAFPNDIHDFSVFPLEGIWRLSEGTKLVKENLEYTIMIRQPDFIRADMVQAALEQVKIKKPSPLLDEMRFAAMQDGKCIEVLHIGAFDEEPASFEKMERFAQENGFKRSGAYHREIYLSNARRVEECKRKTILRYRVT